MSLLEKASLVVTPNAYKESKLYSVIPNTTLGDMDVVRATTATRVNEQGLIESVGVNIPRIDYTNGSCPSLLVEPQRTNLSFPSIYSTLNATYTVNNAISPSGNMDAFSFLPNANSFSYIIFGNINSTQQYTFSIYLKGTVNGQKLKLYGDTNDVIDTFTLTTNWARYTKTFTAVSGLQNIYLLSSNYFTPAENNLYYGYGAQLEQGSYASSYIPTVASSVTRNADIISKTGISSLIGQTEGTAFIECTADNSNPNGAMLIYLGSSDGSGAFNYSTYLKFDGDSLNFTVYSGGNNYVNATSTQTYTNKQNIKVAIAYKNNDFICYANGVQLFTDITGIVSTNLSSLSLGHYPPNIPFNQYNGNIKSTQLYKTRLTNTELAQLTTI